MKIYLKRNHWIILGASLLAVACILSTILYFLNKPTESSVNVKLATGAPFLSADPAWADKVLAGMSLEEKVGQLIMLDFKAYSGGTEDPLQLAEKMRPGAVCLTAGPLKPQLKVLDALRRQKGAPLLAAAQAEAGLLFPSDTLAASPLLEGIPSISNDSVIAQLAASSARQLKSAGIQMNFAPDLDFVQKNGDQSWEPSFRFFLGEVNTKLQLYMEAQQDQGILVCATSFPNYRLEDHRRPDPYKELARPFDSLRLQPFKNLGQLGLSCIQVCNHPAIFNDSVKAQAFDSLHTMFRFTGLVIGDIGGFESNSQDDPGVAELASIKAGSDMVRVSHHVAEVYDYLLNAAQNGQLSREELDTRVKKILLAKSWCGLNKPQPSFSDSSYKLLPWKDAEVAGRRAVSHSLCLLANKNKLVPIKELNGKTASLCISGKRRPRFTGGLDHYAAVNHFLIAPDAKESEFSAMAEKLRAYPTLIVAVYGDIRLTANATVVNTFLHKIEKGKKLVIVHLGRSESLAALDRYPVMIHSFSDDPISQSYTAQAVYGGVPLPALLPFTCSDQFCYNDGRPIKNQSRVKYGIPEESGVSSVCRARIDSIVEAAIRAGAFPGCEVFATCKGNVIINKAYGHHTYDRGAEVKTGDLYDLASVTKVAASTIAIMALYDAGKIDLDTTLNFYFKDLDKNAKGKKVRDSKLNYITLRQVMTHWSGLPSGLPIARFLSPKWYLKYMAELEKRRMEEELNDTLVAEEQSPEWMIDTSQIMMAEDSIFRWLFSKEADKEHKIEIGEEVWMRQAVIDSIWELAKMTAVKKKRSYVYSDMNFYLVMKVVEAVTKTGLEKYVSEKFYKPMNLGRICYNPLKHFDKERIVPTEEEKIFRKQLIHGYVHDPTAALLGGISGNAGLFSTAEDLGILMQMLLNGGTYGGKRYLSEETIKLFTSVQSEGYRGIGWDHQTKSGMKMIAPSASPATYGHTGFTGTCVWVDPVNEVVFVFLSNRVHPKNTNQKINGMRVRQKVQQAIYDAMNLKKTTTQ